MHKDLWNLSSLCNIRTLKFMPKYYSCKQAASLFKNSWVKKVEIKGGGQLVKTHGSVLCGKRNPGHVTDSCVFTVLKKTPFSCIYSSTLPSKETNNFSV